jgi:hypothetical protein
MPDTPKMPKSPPDLIARFDAIAADFHGPSALTFGYPACTSAAT